MIASTRRGHRPFANPGVHVRSWYPLASSRRIRPGKVRTVEALGHRIAVYRGESGRVHALVARCPHMGANLGDGSVRGDRLSCPFHQWTFDGTGRCVSIPSGGRIPRRSTTFSYPVREKFGTVWIFNGPEPTFSLPDFPEETRRLRYGPIRWPIECHHHLVVSNGIDLNHWRCVHGFVPRSDPAIEPVGRCGIRVRLELELERDRRLFRLAGGTRITALLSILGGNLATIEVERPWRFVAFLAHRPRSAGGTLSQLVGLFGPRRGASYWSGLEAASATVKLLLMGLLLMDDKRILREIDFWPRLTEEDALLAGFVQHVNGLETFDATALADGEALADGTGSPARGAEAG